MTEFAGSIKRLRLAFVSTIFLFPQDAGGKIRTCNILRGMKGGKFEITVFMPATDTELSLWASEIEKISDRYLCLGPSTGSFLARLKRLMSATPFSVHNNLNDIGQKLLETALHSNDYDVVVFDFIHSTIYLPPSIFMPTVCFTHNVEAEIFDRHYKVANKPLMKLLWKSQAKKMHRYESKSLKRFDRVVAVSEKDAEYFREVYGQNNVGTVPTVVDLDFFQFNEIPPNNDETPLTIVFTGSMDWIANIDGIEYFIQEVWPKVLAKISNSKLVVVGRRPPISLIKMAERHAGIVLTGFVDDIRPYVKNAHIFIIPLRVGGGTRIKAFEAMAMGCPVVSTGIGIEGLDVRADEHFLLRDSAVDMANGIVDLIDNPARRRAMALSSRALLEEKFGHMAASRAFENICIDAINRHHSG